jgi:RES domain-containing protein
MRVWRLTHAARADSAFSGEGTRVAGSRWLHKGLPAVYTSGSIALAVLEGLVHRDVDQTGPQVAVPVEIPDDLVIEVVLPEDLPHDWSTIPAPITLRDLGSQWLASQRSAVLTVPSALVADEFNLILNPTHPDFSRLNIGGPRPFAFDGRIWS